MLHLTVSNKQHPGLDILLGSSSRFSNLQTRVLGLGNQTPIGHGGKGFGLKLQLLQQELKLVPLMQPVLFTDAWDVIIQENVDKLLQWLEEHPDQVLFAAETVKWPDKDLIYPVPLGFPFPYLNSGVFMGKAKNILELLEKPFDSLTDDQGYYSEQFVVQKDNKIVLDSKGEYFLCMHGIQPNDFHIVNQKLVFQDKIPTVLHLNNGLTRMRWFPFVAKGVLGEPYGSKAKEIVYDALLGSVWQAKYIILAVVIALLFLIRHWIKNKSTLKKN